MTHDEFEKHMEDKFPRMFKDKHYGGFAIGAGWLHIIEALCTDIDNHISWKRKTRTRDLMRLRAKKRGLNDLIKFHAGKRAPTEWDIDAAELDFESEIIVTPRVDHIHIDQIKEKFGGLRFYYSGGDDTVHGMVTMAERWADAACETCGSRGTRRSGGWIRTLCDEHEAEHQERLKEK